MATLAMTAILALVPAVHAYERDESAGTRPINTAQTNVPLPPMRPADLPAAVPVPQLEAPAKEIPSRDPPSGDSSSTLSPYRLHTLPPATRARMHECGVEWQRMKNTGAATDKTWYTFAQTCLAQ
jgi:hypothetical protein